MGRYSKRIERRSACAVKAPSCREDWMNGRTRNQCKQKGKPPCQPVNRSIFLSAVTEDRGIPWFSSDDIPALLA
ncbi:hypothetical protein B0G71_4664 [Paraburkholderia sp. BL27I4N3]|nr:hypothetical protein B0G71_4664 [Paraburkholderia sp. BL27I4N3]RKR38625.1 hypothetical protein B0G82_6778 [Paraburkholderia sp. BL17N1]